MFTGSEYLGSGEDSTGASATDGLVVGDAIGEGERVACDDGGSEAGVVREGGSVTAYAVVGIDERWVVAFGDTPAEARIYVVNGKEIPDDVRSELSTGK